MYAITSKSAPKTGGPFPQGATAARFVFVSGQLPLDPKTNEPVPGGIGQQTARCIMNVEAVLAEQSGAQIMGFSFILELDYLHPREVISKEFPQEIFSLIKVH